MDLKEIEQQFSSAIQGAGSLQELLDIKSRFIGKQGHLSQVLQNLRTLSPEERPVVGSAANKLKLVIEASCQKRLESLKLQDQEKKLQAQAIDVTLPGRLTAEGGLHPISTALHQVESIFESLGFSVHEGPEIESDFYNFEALNIPADHPARDMQDTFYVNVGATGQSPLLLRTHTSPVQIHVMEKQKPPIRMIAPGVVYRRDSDVSHSPMFHQVEGLVVGEGIRFSDLKGTLVAFLDRFFEKKNRIRFRPSYFPFTEPSAEVDVWWEGKEETSPEGALRGRLHSRRSQGGMEGATRAPGRWLEVLGCGMVHPNVFRKVRYDPKRFTGFAFGLGIERLAMLKWGVQDIRLFYENDLRFLRQFR